MFSHSATYSPDDNKLRLYPACRLDADEYQRVKAAGFIWAPKQGLFVAPMWTPGRADLLVEMCGEIGDEDTSLTERAEERSERFEGYQDNRTRDAEAAQRAVSAITDGIPLGQPILVGHHSERHARRDAEKIENGMRRAVKMWDTAQYWKHRAVGAIRHAKYKELPGVRHRRIKGLETDKRREDKHTTEARGWIKMWAGLAKPGKDGISPASAELQLKRATYIANYTHVSLPATDAKPFGDTLWSALDEGRITPRAAQLVALKAHARTIAHSRRWLAHLALRLDYERAMLAESGGLVTDNSPFPIVPGGRVLVRDEWLAVLRVNKSNGTINSLTTQPPAHVTWTKKWKFGVEQVKDYQPPTTEDAKAVKEAKKLPPLVNYNGDGFRQMTAADYRKYPNDYKSTRIQDATSEHGAYRQRTSFKGGGGQDSFNLVGVFLTDAKVVERPSADESITPKPLRRVRVARQAAPETTTARPTDTAAETFEAMRQSVAAGVKAVSAPQLFPTPVALAERLVSEAHISQGSRVLEPSAGTGRILDAIISDADGEPVSIVAVELNGNLVSNLTAKYQPVGVAVHQADFMDCNGNIGRFDRVVMNPPFVDGQDIDHVQHAYEFLNPGGRLVAVMGEGAFFRSDKKAKDFRNWLHTVSGDAESLPDDSFKESGTGVRSRLVIIDKADA